MYVDLPFSELGLVRAFTLFNCCRTVLALLPARVRLPGSGAISSSLAELSLRRRRGRELKLESVKRTGRRHFWWWWWCKTKQNAAFARCWLVNPDDRRSRRRRDTIPTPHRNQKGAERKCMSTNLHIYVNILSFWNFIISWILLVSYQFNFFLCFVEPSVEGNEAFLSTTPCVDDKHHNASGKPDDISMKQVFMLIS
jgi:hypothetical protein